MGLGWNTAKRQNRPKVSQTKPYTLLNLLKLVFFDGILKTSGPKDRKIKACHSNFASSAVVCWIDCKTLAAHPITECTSKAVKINQMSHVLINMNNIHNMKLHRCDISHNAMSYTYMCSHDEMLCWDATLKSCNTTYHKITWYCIISESLLWYQDARTSLEELRIGWVCSERG